MIRGCVGRVIPEVWWPRRPAAMAPGRIYHRAVGTLNWSKVPDRALEPRDLSNGGPPVLVRRLARPMLSSIFVTAGFNSVRNPDRAAPTAAPVVDKLRSVLPRQVASLIPADPAKGVRLNGAVQVVGGLMLATGKFPRVGAVALAGSLLPTTLAGHAFWQEDDPAKRAHQQIQFFKNLSLFGGLLIAAVDTEGKPSAAWRSRAAAHRAGEAVASALPSGQDSSQTVSSLKDTVGTVAAAAKEHSAHLASVAKAHAPVVAEAVRERSEAVAGAAREQAPVFAEAVRERGGEAGRRAAKRASKAARQARAQLA
ncbi:DoxX family protein [Flexivirga alba]|uniref:DoxX family protein n=1 Tax=Flexivirga alba TaxID=702742 RepID=A0ABW2AL75_9MICO